MAVTWKKLAYEDDVVTKATWTTQGDIVTRNATVPKRLALGTEGYYLKAGANEPEWAAVVGGYTEGARVYNNANISIPDTTPTTLTFNSERYDTDNIHSTISATERLTCKTAGKYLISIQVEFAANVTGIRQLYIFHNGTTVIAIQTMDAVTVAGRETRIGIATIYDLAINAYVIVKAFQTSGGALNVRTQTAWSPEFMMQRIG